MEAPSTRCTVYDTVGDPSCFYDYLASQNQKATVFYVGSNAPDLQLEAQRAVAGVVVSISMYVPRFRHFEYPGTDLSFLLEWDRICYITQSLDLTTMTWKYGSLDWLVGLSISPRPMLIPNYGLFINNETTEAFDPAGGVHSWCSHTN